MIMHILVNNNDGKIVFRTTDIEKMKDKASELCSNVASSYTIYSSVCTISSRLTVTETH